MPCRKAWVRQFWSDPKKQAGGQLVLCLLPCPSPEQPGGHGSAKWVLGTANTALTRVWCSGLLAHLKDENLMVASSSRPWKGQAPGRSSTRRRHLLGALFSGFLRPYPYQAWSSTTPSKPQSCFPRQCVNVPPQVLQRQARPGSCWTGSIFTKSGVLLILLD